MARQTDFNLLSKRMNVMSPEDRAFLDKVMTEYIRKNYKKNRCEIRKRLRNIDDDIVDELQQRYYIWLYTHLEPSVLRNIDNIETRVQKLYTILVKHPSIYRVKEYMLKGIVNEIENEDGTSTVFEAVDEIEETFTNGHLSKNIDNETRIELFYIARKETLEWLNDNPDSNTAKAIKNTIEKVVKVDNKTGPHYHKEKVFNDLVDYITAPNPAFFWNMFKKHLNLSLINVFKEEFAAMYNINGGKPVKHAQLHTTRW